VPASCRPIAAGQRSAPPARPAHHHIDLLAPTLGADEPVPLIKGGRTRTVLLVELGGVRLDLMPAAPALNDQPQLGLRRAAECHQAGLGFYERSASIAAVAKDHREAKCGPGCPSAGGACHLATVRLAISRHDSPVLLYTAEASYVPQ
jgi:hypothetical protein